MKIFMVMKKRYSVKHDWFLSVVAARSDSRSRAKVSHHIAWLGVRRQINVGLCIPVHGQSVACVRERSSYRSTVEPHQLEH